MTIRTLPKIELPTRPKAYVAEIPADVLARYALMPQAAEADDPAVISIYAPIGADYWSDGFTAARMAGALRRIGASPVTVNINSPGGDVFEGIAIYNLLREHKARVDVKVMGIAASAASVIAMAGDGIAMGVGSMLMVHNVWGMVVGNRHDMTKAAELFASIDGGLVDIYQARTGQARADIEKLMDSETFMSLSRAIELGYADTVDEGIDTAAAGADEGKGGASNALPAELAAWRQIEAILALQGVSRTERRRLKRDLTGGTRDAAPSVTHDADLDRGAIASLIAKMRS